MKRKSLVKIFVLLLATAFIFAFAAACATDGGMSGTSNARFDVEFSGAKNLNIKLNEQVDWTDGVTATRRGETLDITADVSKVDVTKTGKYEIEYHAGGYYVKRNVRVYGMPVITDADGEVISDGYQNVITYEQASAANGLANGLVATDSFGDKLEVTGSSSTFSLLGGEFDASWTAVDAAGNEIVVSGKVKLDPDKFPTVLKSNLGYDLSDEGLFVPVDVKGAQRLDLYENGAVINHAMFDTVVDPAASNPASAQTGVLLSGAYFDGAKLGKHDFTMMTEYGYASFSATVTDSEEISMTGLILALDKFAFKVGERIQFSLPAHLGKNYQRVSISVKAHETGDFTPSIAGEILNIGSFDEEGTHEFDVTLTRGTETKTETMSFRVASEDEYARLLPSGNNNQFMDRVSRLQMKTAQLLDPDKYDGATSAIHHKATITDVFNQGLLLSDFYDVWVRENVSSISFDVWFEDTEGTGIVNRIVPAFCFHKPAIVREGGTKPYSSKYIYMTVKDKKTGETLFVPDGTGEHGSVGKTYSAGAAHDLTNLKTGAWYTFTLDIERAGYLHTGNNKVDGDEKVNMYLYMTNPSNKTANNTYDFYIRNMTVNISK